MSKRKLDAVEARTIETFDLEAELQSSTNPPTSVVGEDLCYAFSRAGTNPLILDVGCGDGRVIPYLQQIGEFRYIGIDPSVEMLKIGKRKFPEIDFRTMNLYELPYQFPEPHFNLAIAITTLSYVTPMRMREALTSIRRVLKPGGIAFFTFMNVDETLRFAQNRPQSSTFTGPAATVYGWRFERISPVLKRAGFKIEDIYTGNMCLYTVIATVT